MEKIYFDIGYFSAKSGEYGFGIGGKIRAYEESFDEKVVGGSSKWMLFLKGFDYAIEELNFYYEI